MSVKVFPARSDKTSVILTPLKSSFPVLVATRVYVIVSSRPMIPSLLVSDILAAFVNTIDDDGGGVVAILVIVGSFWVFPSLSSPSSLISKISFVFPGLLAITVTVFDTPPASIACCVMIKLAL